MESAIDPRMQYVYVGDEVFIRRSRRQTYQKAEVVSVTPKHGFVNVEWVDADGNMWGREVTIRDLLDLNPFLVANRLPPNMPRTGPMISYKPSLKQDNTEITEQSKSTKPEDADPKRTADKKKWLEEMQARLTDVRIRSTTIPNNSHSRQRCVRESESQDGDDANLNAASTAESETPCNTTLRMIGEASDFFKNMLSGRTSKQEDAPPDPGNPTAERASSQGQLSIYYDDVRSAQGNSSIKPCVAYKPKSLQDPFHSPLLDEMFAAQAMQAQTNGVLQHGSTNFNSCVNNNEVNSYSLEKTYSSVSSKKQAASKRNLHNLKPTTPGANISPKCKNNESARSYSRPSVPNNSHSLHSASARRPPTVVPSVGIKPPNDPFLTPPSVSGLRHKSSVVEAIQRLEREREIRRRKQEERRAEENALRLKDPGNANWKFSMMVNEYRQHIFRDPLKMTDPIKQTRIIVCIRKRPLNAKEMERKEIDIVTVPNKDLVLIHEPKAKLDMTKYLENHCYRFDYTFDENSTNELVYHFTTKPLIETFFEGGMATVFAYGQTGSGKTHTMGGNFNGTKQDSSNGIYMNVARDIFSILTSRDYEVLGLRLSVTFFEIYKAKLYDLLSGKNEIKVMEDVDQQIQIVGLTELYVNSFEEVVSLIRKGNSARTSGRTIINPMSSRSHSVFQLILRQNHEEDRKGQIYGKFSLIDLAGNERGVGKGAVVDRQLEIEGAEINKSLLALKECIRALSRNEGHIPFRGSKLTLVLKDTFMNANSRVCMIGTVSPGHSSCNCSLNTILYANRVKEFNASDPFHDDGANSGKQ